MADTLRERLIRTAYLDLAVEHGLTIMPGPDGLPLVPGHWREQAEQHATAALAPGTSTTTVWGARPVPYSDHVLSCDDQDEAERTVRGSGYGVVVTRTVTSTPWREVTP